MWTGTVVLCAGNVSEIAASEAIKAGMASVQVAEAHRKEGGLLLTIILPHVSEHCLDAYLVEATSALLLYYIFSQIGWMW